MNINKNEIKFIYSQDEEKEKRKQKGITLIAFPINTLRYLR